MGRIARVYHVLPREAQRDLESDPEQLSVVCLALTTYADAFHDYRKNSKAAMEAWKGSPVMEEVQRREYEAAAGVLGVSLESDGGEAAPEG